MLNKTLVFILLVFVLGFFSSCTTKAMTNWNFEDGDFSSWLVTGDSFSISSEQKYDEYRYYLPEGQFHVLGSVENLGTLTSKPFLLEGSAMISFLISGSMSTSRVEIVLQDNDVVLYSITNSFYEEPIYTNTYLRVNVDCSEYLGDTVYLRVVDDSTEDYINVDDFVINVAQEEVNRYLSETNIRIGLDRYENMIDAANMYIKLNAWKINPSNRFSFHVTGETGWINDPNGFSFYQDKIQLFYQHNPYQTQWGPMHWGHVTSTDFIRWTYEDIALAPDKDYDVVGAFSGSAIEVDGVYYLVYTGASVDGQVQAIASSMDGIHYEKYDLNPVISALDLPANTTIADFRDPKVWIKDGFVYMIVSARNATNQYSKLLLYKTTDMKTWSYAGRVFANNSNYTEKLGVMFECPDLFTIDDTDVIVVSPQGVPGHQNADGNVYITGNLNYATGEFENWNYDSIQTIDNGFDFYAPTTMLMPDGRRIMIAWMASWNRKPIYYTEGFAGALTLPRELTIVNGRLYQTPVREIENYYQNLYSNTITIGGESIQYVPEMSGLAQDITIEFDVNSGKSGISVFDDGLGNSMKIYYQDGRVYLDRHGVTNGFYSTSDLHNVTSAEALVIDGKLKIRLILDRYSVEVFVSDGYRTITATGFPSLSQNQVGLFSDLPTAFTILQHDIVID